MHWKHLLTLKSWCFCFGCRFYFWGKSSKNLRLYRLAGPQGGIFFENFALLLGSCLSYMSPTILLPFLRFFDALSWVCHFEAVTWENTWGFSSILSFSKRASWCLHRADHTCQGLVFFFLVGIEVVIGLAGFQQLINTCFCHLLKDSRCIDLLMCMCVCSASKTCSRSSYFGFIAITRYQFSTFV